MNKNKVLIFVAALGFATVLPSAARATELITNGGFEVNGGNGQLGATTTATGWSVSGGYTFVYNPEANTTSGTSADNSGANGQYGNLSLWGPGNGVANGLTNSPTGGAFIAQDSAFQQSPLTQSVSGLTVGQTYSLSFDWAGAQQNGFTGPTFDQWDVSLGSQTQSTPVVNLANHGFSGWMHQVFTYTATSSTETLSFFATGGPQGVPPFALLDNVSMQAVPETGTGITMLLGVAGFAVIARRRAQTAKSCG